MKQDMTGVNDALRNLYGQSVDMFLKGIGVDEKAKNLASSALMLIYTDSVAASDFDGVLYSKIANGTGLTPRAVREIIRKGFVRAPGIKSFKGSKTTLLEIRFYAIQGIAFEKFSGEKENPLEDPLKPFYIEAVEKILKDLSITDDTKDFVAESAIRIYERPEAANNFREMVYPEVLKLTRMPDYITISDIRKDFRLATRTGFRNGLVEIRHAAMKIGTFKIIAGGDE